MKYDIIKDYDSGISIRDLAKKYNKSSSTIHRILKSENKTRSIDASWIIRGSTKLNKDDIIKEYNDGSSVLQLSKKYKCSRNKIQKILNDNDIEKNINTNKIIDIRKETMLEKYGVEHYTNRDKAIETTLIRYGVKFPMESNVVLNNIKLSNYQKYGVDWINQHPLSKYQQEKLNNKDWLIKQHHNNKITLNDISNTLDVSGTTLARYMNKHNIEIKRFSVSSQERKIYNELSQYNINIIQNDRNIIKPLELDFYFPDHDLAIEVNGLYWHNEDHKDKMYHENKRVLCEEKGITLLQFWDYEINDNFDLIISMILNYCKKTINNRIYARKCKIVNISKNKEFITDFLDNNHIQGHTNISICYGLEYEDKIVSIMGFNKSNLKQYDYSLVRFCSLKGHSVIGGASKLLKQMRSHKLVSYSDGRYSNGGLYKTLGFELIKINNPDYKYTHDYKQLHHKFGFRRKSIKSKYPEYYSDNLTEKEMMNRIGYKRVYGCSIKTWKLLNV